MHPHDISNAGAAESGHYAAIDADEKWRLRLERTQAACDKIIAEFDGQHVMTAIDVVSANDPARMHKLYAALAQLVEMPCYRIEDDRLRNAVQAFQAVAHYYSGYTVGQEQPQ
jgi:hypothetical protein